MEDQNTTTIIILIVCGLGVWWLFSSGLLKSAAGTLDVLNRVLDHGARFVGAVLRSPRRIYEWSSRQISTVGSALKSTWSGTKHVADTVRDEIFETADDAADIFVGVGKDIGHAGATVGRAVGHAAASGARSAWRAIT